MTSSLGGSITAPKSQNGIRGIQSLVLSASNAPQPPFADCIPAVQSSPRPHGVLPHPELAQRERDHRGVVDVGIEVVLVLEGPAARGEVRPAHRPVALDP